MKNISLQFSIEEANLILEALGNLPFSKVFALIAKIQAQASQQLNGEGQAQLSDNSNKIDPVKD